MLKEFLEYKNEFRLLYNSKLTKREGWKNVREHDVIQLFGARVLGNLLGLSDDQQKSLESVALVHDAGKRFNKFPEDFSSDEKEKFKSSYEKVNPDEKLMTATGPDFLEKVLYTEVSMLEFLQFYLDDITRGSEIVSFDERINEVSARRHDLNNDQELTKRLGGRRYWELEREIGHAVEEVIYKRLLEKGIALKSPKDIPDLINCKIKEQSKNV